MELVLATRNLGKKREIKRILKPLGLDMRGIDEFPDAPETEETGKTFEENAILKAIAIAEFTKSIVLADDSGLEVDALGGKPGIFSARFAGEEANDFGNNQKLLSEMENVPQGQRYARFVCSIAIAVPGKLIGTLSGVCDGEIATCSRGQGGFGYDPLFIVRDYNLTFAELNVDIKNKISHRAKALEKAFLLLERYLINRENNS